MINDLVEQAQSKINDGQNINSAAHNVAVNVPVERAAKILHENGSVRYNKMADRINNHINGVRVFSEIEWTVIQRDAGIMIASLITQSIRGQANAR